MNEIRESDSHEITPENLKNFSEFISKMKQFFDVVIRRELSVETSSVLGDDELIQKLIYSMNWIEIDLAYNTDEDAKRLKTQAKHILEGIDAITRGDDNEVLQNSLNLLIEGLADFEHLNRGLIDENFIRLQELGKLDLTLVDKYLE